MEQVAIDTTSTEIPARITELGEVIAGAEDEFSIGKALHNHAASLIPLDGFSLYLCDGETRAFALAYAAQSGDAAKAGDSDDDAEAWLYRPRGSLDGNAALCARTGKDSIITEDRSSLHCAIRTRDRVIAVASAHGGPGMAYDGTHLEILRALGSSAGMALESARLRAERRQAASADPLTGILNRPRFLEIFALETDKARRYAGELSYVLFDLDRFRDLSEGLGRDAGDQVLKSAAKLASKGLRSTDFLARYDDEEFALLLPNTGIDGATIVAERIRSAFERETLNWGDSAELKFTASFGVTSYGEGDCFDTLTARAAKALRYSRETGCNKVAAERASARRSGAGS